MAKFEDVLPALREGKQIRRANWCHEKSCTIPNTFVAVAVGDLISHDWEIVEEKPLPCPFCGGNATHNGQNLRVFCQNPKCHAAGPENRFKTEAVELWNKAKR